MSDLAGTPALAAFLPSLLQTRLGESLSSLQDAPQVLDGAVLFVDIVGSTDKTDRLAGAGPDGAERLGEFLNVYFGALIDIVLRLGGDVVRIDGDALIAFWPERAGYEAPLRAAERVRDVRPVWPVDPEERLQHRIVVAGGRFRLMVLAGPDRRNFLLFAGDPLVRVGEILRAGQPGDVVVDHVVAERLPAEAVAVLQPGRAWRKLPRGPEGADPLISAPPPGVPHADLAAFVPRMVVDRAALGFSEWLAEFRDICVVFVRLGDSDLSDAAEAARVQANFAVVAAAAAMVGVEIHDVRAVEKGVIAIIGSGLPPYGSEGRATRAVEMARRIRNETAGQGHDCALGVALGRVFCGDIGNATRREYILSGPVMGTAARLMEAASGEVLCDSAAAQAAGPRFDFTPVRALPIRGRETRLPVCDLIEARVAAAPVEHGRALHGREAPLTAGLTALDAALSGEGGLLALESEPGAGKSRLLAEFARHARERGCAVIATAADAIDRSTAYYAFRSVLAGLLPALTPASLLAALEGTGLAPRAALMDDVLPFGFAEPGLAAQIRGAARRDGIEAIIASLFRRQMATPTILIVDDLHWIDSLSADLLLALRRSVPGLLIIAGSRPVPAGGEAPRVLGRATRIVLDRLTPAASVAMACELLDARWLAPRLAELIQQRSGGLPIHLEQLALALRERGLVAVIAGRAEVSPVGLEANAVPPKLREIIVARIDRLSQTDQIAAKVASTVGRMFDLAMLAEIYPLPVGRAELGKSVERLAGAGFVAAEGAGYVFRHAIIQETTHELLSYGQRRTLHRAVAEAIERRPDAMRDTSLTELAYHWEEANEAARALEYRARAASLAVRRYANHDALDHAERAAALARQAKLPLPLDVTTARGEAYHALSQFKLAEGEFRSVLTAMGVAQARTTLGLAASVARQVSLQCLHRFGIVSKYRMPAERELARVSAHFHTRFAEHAYFMRNALALVHGSLTALNRAESVDSYPEMIEGYGGLAIGLGTANAHPIARYYRRRCIDVAERFGEMPDRAFAHLLAGVYSFQAGDWTAMRTHFGEGIAICRELGDLFRLQSCQVVLAYGEMVTGHYDAAAVSLSEFGEVAEMVDNVPVRAWVLAGASVLDMLRGAAPEPTLRRMESARHHSLHRAETLLLDGLEAAAWLRAGDQAAAVAAGRRALEDMQDSVCTMGIAMHSVHAVGRVFLTLAERDRAFLPEATAACRAVQRYAAQTRICRPLAALLAARLARLKGGRPPVALPRVLARAEQLGLPLERALVLHDFGHGPGPDQQPWWQSRAC